MWTANKNEWPMRKKYPEVVWSMRLKLQSKYMKQEWMAEWKRKTKKDIRSGRREERKRSLKNSGTLCLQEKNGMERYCSK